MENYPPIPKINENQTHKWFITVISLALYLFVFKFFLQTNFTNIILITVAVLLHELGHLMAMKYYKYKDVGIFFLPLFGAATIGNKDEIKQDERSMIILAGPLSGILLGAMLFVLGYNLHHQVILSLSVIFLVLNVFNLLPLLPLDGGRLVETLFMQSKSKVLLAFAILSMLGFVVIAFIYKSYTLLYIIPLLIGGLIGNQGNLKLREKLIKAGFNLNKTYAQLSPEEYWKMREYLMENKLQAGDIAEPNDYTEMNDEHLKVKQISSLLHSEPIHNLNYSGKIKFILLWILGIGIPILILFWGR